MRNAILLLWTVAILQAADIPSGFTPIFNGENLQGWHISQVNHHGDTKAWTVKDGVLMGTQEPYGNGGILLTDKKYRDFEVSLDVNPDFGCDGGLFLRSNEKGQAYQVMLDYLEGGSIGGIYGEGLQGVGGNTGSGDKSGREWKNHWKKGEWNHVRARIEGDIPHIQVWLNGTQIVDWTDSTNHAADGATEGMIAVQVHLTDPNSPKGRWTKGGYHRFRNIAVKEL
jgi:hypothetical protein